MDDVLAAAAEVQTLFQTYAWRFAIIGGVANAAWGQIRATQDVDFTLLTLFQDEAEFIDRILETYETRIADAKSFALEARVLLLAAPNGIGIDVGLGGFPYEEQMIERAMDFDFGRGRVLRIASPEDLILLKAFAGRMQDWADVEGIVRRQGVGLDWPYIDRQALEFAEIKEDPSLLEKLEAIRLRWP
ncbi:MAG TPA: nucleotidyl transferase AbiEii/AbiGii toxin family protein [Fimbriimonadaceae bacterium]|nr:nucleotidyl transferase AbiEii/AbiGii toxin family protein [Fimbriimonadaceae bacterium]